MIRVFIVEKAPLTCVLIAATFSKQSGFEVAGYGPGISEQDLPRIRSCDFILINATLSNDETLQQIRYAAQVLPGVRCVVMGLPESESVIKTYLDAGAAGYIPSHELAETLPRYIEILHQTSAQSSSWRQDPG